MNNVVQALQSDNIEDKAAIIDTLLNRVIVYKDRVEVFLNLLPINDMNSDLQITDEDIESCGLLEPTQKEKVAQKSDFPSEKNFGEEQSHKYELAEKEEGAFTASSISFSSFSICDFVNFSGTISS